MTEFEYLRLFYDAAVAIEKQMLKEQINPVEKASYFESQFKFFHAINIEPEFDIEWAYDNKDNLNPIITLQIKPFHRIPYPSTCSFSLASVDYDDRKAEYFANKLDKSIDS
jgi:hypothetical protein